MDIFIFMIGLVIYFIPWMVSKSRKSNMSDSIMVINLFLGWTLIGWVIALAMAVYKK